MLKVIQKKADIKKASEKFTKKFEIIADSNIYVRVGYPGGDFQTKVKWINELGIWICSYTRYKRHINLFGIGKPVKDSLVPITCEINFPVVGINRRFGGAFISDSSEEVFVAHRGKIGGGRKGIGKSLFEDNYRGEWTTIEDGDSDSDVALIGALSSQRFVDQVRQFVFEIDRIKKSINSPESKAKTLHNDKAFREEFSGKKKQYKVGNYIEAKCDHGLIVNTLSNAMKELGYQVFNDRNRDLYIIGKNKVMAAIFEVKTDISTSSIYSAIGQLLLNSIDVEKNPRLFLTVPEKINKFLETKLSRLGIEIITYKWRRNNPVFPKFNILRL